MSDLSELDGEALLWIARELERFDAAWERGEPIPLEDLLREATDKGRAELLTSALVVELTYRRARGESPTLEEYGRRFPEHLEIIRAAFAEPVIITIPPGSTTDRSSFGSSVTEWPPAPGSGPLPETIGKYIVLRRLGTGGQGETFLARDPDVGNLVVLKRYHGSASEGDAIREAQAQARVRSRHTVACYGTEHDGDKRYLVMEYIPGRSLKEIAEGQRRPPGPETAALLIEQVAEGLEAVHACGLLHRDIKPSNIVVGDDGVPRLVDFGLAAHLGSAALRGVSGTVPYMAPEVARDQWERIDARTDVYGLGATLYALLTRQPPHQGAREAALEHARQGVVTPPRALNRSIPRPLERIVLRALAADPAQRFTTAAEFRRALRRYRLRHWYRAAGLAVVLVLAGLIGALLWPVLNPEPPSPAAAPLSGELTVRVWTPGGGSKRGWKVEEPGALPVLPGELAHLEVRLSRPAYAYLLWLDGQGQVASLYPWRDRGFGTRPDSEAVHESVHSPAELDRGWPVRGPGGLETALLLVRPTPLPRETDLPGLIGRLPPAPLRDPQEVAVRGFDRRQPTGAIDRGEHRGLGPEKERIDDPLLQLMERLQPHFEVIRAVRFAYRGESSTAPTKVGRLAGSLFRVSEARRQRPRQ